MNTEPNPITIRDLVTDEPNGFVLEGAIRELLAHGWPVPAILAECPTIGEADIRRVERRAA